MDEKDLERIVLQGLKYEAIEKEKAAERKALTRKYGLKPEEAKYSQDTTGQTRDIVAEKLGISGKQWERMKYIYQHKRYLSKQEYLCWRTGKVSTSQIYNRINRIIKSEKQISKINRRFEKIFKGNLYFPDKDKRIYDFKKNLSLYNYPDRIKREIFEALEISEKALEDFLDKQYGDLTILSNEIKILNERLEKLENNT